jgi:hypothetical protein
MIKQNNLTDYVEYLGKMVPREHFRVFVYSQDGKQKLVNSWNEYQEAIGSGMWFAEKQPLKQRKKERVSDGTDS